MNSIIEEFSAFCASLGFTPDNIIADGSRHRFRPTEDGRRSGKPAGYVLHNDEYPTGIVWDWRQGKEKHIWHPDRVIGRASRIDLREHMAKRHAAIAEARKAGIESARERWDAAPRLNGHGHPYLSTKGISAPQARLEGDRLLIPAYGPDRRIQTVQAILADGRTKLFHKGAPSEGCFLPMGSGLSQTKAGDTVFVCEGYATARSVFDATGAPTICTFDSTNMPKVAKWLAHEFPGRAYVVAGDDDWHLPIRNPPLPNAGRVAAEASASLLCGAVLFPDMGDVERKGGEDFNDMAQALGLNSVRALLVDGVTPAGEEAINEAPSVAIQPLTPFDIAAIPVRPWVIKGWLLRRNVAMLIAPPGVGKSTITLHQAIAIATGTTWAGWKVEKACNVLLINVEDDIDEMRRRTAAALEAMDLDQSDIAGKLFIHDGEREFLITQAGESQRETVWSPLVAELIETIRRHKIGVTIVDPFAETFNGDENDNNGMKKAATGFRHIARTTDTAVLLVQHTSKAASTSAGDMNASRGGSAQVGVVRTAATLFPMLKEDAARYGLPDKDCRFYVRWDDAKSNQSLIGGEARWFRKVSVDIGNGAGLVEGDNVGALEPWSPPDVFENLGVSMANQILDQLAGGTLKMDRRAIIKGEWAGLPVMRIAERTEEQALQILKEWKRNGVIEVIKDTDPITRKVRDFVRVNHDRRPK